MWAALLPYLYQAVAGAAVGKGMQALTDKGGSSMSTPDQPRQMQAPDVIGSLMQYMQQSQKGNKQAELGGLF